MLWGEGYTNPAWHHVECCMTGVVDMSIEQRASAVWQRKTGAEGLNKQ